MMMMVVVMVVVVVRRDGLCIVGCSRIGSIQVNFGDVGLDVHRVDDQ